MKAYIESYGCAHNESDARVIKAVLEAFGVEITSSASEADFIFINTCGVKSTTEQRMLSRIQVLSQEKAVLIVCGCLPRINALGVKKAAPDCFFLDTNSLHKIPDMLARPRDFISESREDKYSLPFSEHGTTAVMQISEGCLGECSYCAVKKARGTLHSYAPEQITAAVASAVNNRAREIYLAAEDTGCYGADIGSSLPELMKQVSFVPGDFRVRIGMMSPNKALDILSQLLEQYENKKIYKFVHLPVQSGNDQVLCDMRRAYTVSEFERVVSVFRKKFPSITVSTDVIVGFPTETKKAFLDTMGLLEKVRPDIVNVSRFGARPGTPAARLKPLPSEEVKERSRQASSLARMLSLESNEKCVGEEHLILGLLRCKGGVAGRLPNYKKTVFCGEPGKSYCVKVVRASVNHLEAEVI